MASIVKKIISNEPRMGETVALQPLSGIKLVSETFAVNGMGRAGYVRREETEKTAAAS